MPPWATAAWAGWPACFSTSLAPSACGLRLRTTTSTACSPGNPRRRAGREADNWRTFYTPWQIQRPQTPCGAGLRHVEHGRDRHGSYNPCGGLEGGHRRAARHADRRHGAHRQLLACSPPGPAGSRSALLQRRRLHQRRAAAVTSETISKVLYPSDSAEAGRSCGWCRNTSCRPAPSATSSAATSPTTPASTVQRQGRHAAQRHAPTWRCRADAHLVDEHDLPWDKAWETPAPPSPTQPTLLSEALEKWP